MNRNELPLYRRLAPQAGALLLALACAFAWTQGASAQTTGGTLNGRVQDKSGGALPGVTITATEKSTGYERSTVSGPDGGFTLPALPVGTYTVKAELSGFGTVTVEDVKINVASTRTLEISMSQAAMQESITVVDEAPLIPNTPSVGAVISQQELQNLPLNGRQFANLGVLAPGTQLGYNSDPTKPGQLVIVLNGGSGRNVNYTIDGGDNTDDTIGGALQNFSVEGVQEFKIQTMEYKAEYGRSTGGVLSVITKSGTNRFAGSVYDFFRNQNLADKTETEKVAGANKQKIDRKQYGASLGGPIVRDRVHFFATYEKTDRKTLYTVNTKPSAAAPPIFPDLQGQSFPTPFKDELAAGKLSFDVNPKNYLQVRYGYQKNSDKYGAAPTATPNSLGTVTNNYKSLLGGYTSQIGADMLNELIFQYSKFDNKISADSNLPTIYFPSGVTSGQNAQTPQATRQTKYQYKDDFSFTSTLGGRRHDFKTGLAYINEPVLAGDFSVGTTGQFSHLHDDVNSPFTDITFFGGFNGQKTPIKEYSAYFQDDWNVASRLTLNLGLRYDLWTGFDLNQTSNPIWQVLSTQTRYHEGYLQDFQGGGGGKLKNDRNDWGPRLGFTWDVKGDGKKLLRGGWGIYYDFPYTNATILFPAGAVQSNYGVVYNVHSNAGITNPNGTFWKPGDPLPPNGITGGANPPNEVASPTLKTPYSRQGSLGYSWQVNNWLGLNFEGLAINYEHIPFRFRANPIDPATGNRRFPQLGNFRLWYGKGSALYSGFNFGWHIRVPGNRLSLQGFYTYSEARGNVIAGADEFRLTYVQYQRDLGNMRDVSINPLNPTCSFCTGPLVSDARHRVTFGAVYQAPWGINLASMFRYHSATPYLIRDAGGNVFGFRYIPVPGVGINSGRGGSFEQFDLRISKDFTVAHNAGIEILAEVFNVFNAKNPANFDGVVGTTAPDASGKLVFTPNPHFGQPFAFAGDPLQGEQRLVQVGARIHF
jgi:hypothetical protein